MPVTTRIIISAISLLAGAFASNAQEPADSTQVQQSIVEHITGQGVNTIDMPEALLRRVVPEQTVHTDVSESQSAQGHGAVQTGGYRIQVFSDSNPRTAQGEARAKSSNISSRFPSLRTYVTYDSPYWRLRVGDFTTYEDAADALATLKEAFPSYRRELRIVRDHINQGY